MYNFAFWCGAHFLCGICISIDRFSEKISDFSLCGKDILLPTPSLSIEAKIQEDGQQILCQIPKLLNLHHVVTLSWIAIIEKHFA